MSKIRIATGEDASDLLAIYAPFILQSGVTQETEVPTSENFQQRIMATLEERPWLVCEMDQQIAGYAYAGRHRERKGYQWCTETSVYVHAGFLRQGVASALYSALLELLKWQGYVNVYAVITLPNEKSVALHEKLGFHYLTTYKKIGYKLGQWHDVGWWEMQINVPQVNLSPPVKFPALNQKSVATLLHQASAG